MDKTIKVTFMSSIEAISWQNIVPQSTSQIELSYSDSRRLQQMNKL
jgi:hypothetical protein